LPMPARRVRPPAAGWAAAATEGMLAELSPPRLVFDAAAGVAVRARRRAGVAAVETGVVSLLWAGGVVGVARGVGVVVVIARSSRP